MFNAIYPGVTGETIIDAGTDAAQSITSTVLEEAATGRRCLGAFISADENDLRIAFGGATPTQGTHGLGHLLEAGSSLFVSSWGSISSMQYINAINSVVGYIQITPVF